MSTGVLRYEDRESTTMTWILIFILLSLLAHVILIGLIVLITHFLPAPKMHTPIHSPDTVKVTLIQPPPLPAAKPQKTIFVPTQPQQNVPHKLQKVESANDTLLHSESKVARNPNSIMPDLNGKEHNSDMKNSPNVPTEQKQEVSSTPPTPRQQTQPQPQKPTPPQPKVQNGPRPDQPQQKPNPVPPKPAPKPTQQIDPLTGLPVLPPIQAQTLAQANPQQQALAPARSRQQQETSVNGAIGMSEDNSPAAMATPRGKYMQTFRNIVGSYWYPAVDSQMSLISVGTVVIRFTVHSDGTISDITVLQGNDNPNFVLKNISVSALRSPAPFPPFPPEMIKDVGTSFTDEFSFGIY